MLIINILVIGILCCFLIFGILGLIAKISIKDFDEAMAAVFIIVTSVIALVIWCDAQFNNFNFCKQMFMIS